MEITIYSCSKLFSGYSTCFRQHRATHSHCKYLHGYGISFKVWFDCKSLDDRGWVLDFSWKHTKHTIQGLEPLDWFKWLFDHTVLVSEKDPELRWFKKMHAAKIIQLRVIPETGCEMFAGYILQNINEFLRQETNDRVWARRVEFREHENNSASASIGFKDEYNE